MVRTPCCKEEGVKKGAWTPEEDEKLIAYINKHGEGGWRTLPEKAGLRRCGKSCRLRWANYLRPDIKRGDFTEEEEETIIKLHASCGNKWSAIARRLPGRTDNEIKNYWNTHIKKRLIQKGIDPASHKPIDAKGDCENESSDNSGTSKAHCSKRFVTPCARLLNRVASNRTFKVNQAVLSGIINGGAACDDDAMKSLMQSPPNMTSKLLNRMAAKPTMLRAVLSSSVDETGQYDFVQNKGYSDQSRSTSTSTSNFSDDVFDIPMLDSDSATTFNSLFSCLDTPTHDSQCATYTNTNLDEFGANIFSSSTTYELNTFQFPEFLNLQDGDEFGDMENNGLMKELREILKNADDDENLIPVRSDHLGGDTDLENPVDIAYEF